MAALGATNIVGSLTSSYLVTGLNILAHGHLHLDKNIGPFLVHMQVGEEI